MSSNPVVHVIDDDDAARASLAFLLGTAQFVVRAYEAAKAFLDAIQLASNSAFATSSDGTRLSVRRLPGLQRPEPAKVARRSANFVDAADIPLAAEHQVSSAILVDFGPKSALAHLEGHQLASSVTCILINSSLRRIPDRQRARFPATIQPGAERRMEFSLPHAQKTRRWPVRVLLCPHHCSL